MKVAIYSRVSTKKQEVDMQVSDLRRYCGQRGFAIYKEYSDQGVSGTKDNRPALNDLMSDARKRRFDTVLCWRFDRFGRSSRHMINCLEEFRSLEINFISYQEGIDTTTAFGKCLYTVSSAFAELERNIIVERINAGLRRARENGKVLGRPKRLNLNLEELQKLRDQGLSFKKISDKVGGCPATIYKTLKILRQETLENKGSETKEMTI